MPSGRDQRSSLLAAKLRWLLEASGPGAERTVDCPVGAAAEAAGRTWVLPDESRTAPVGFILAWAIARGIDRIGIVAVTDAGVVARHASHFDADIDVRAIRDESLVAVDAAPHRDVPVLDRTHAGLAAIIEAAGAEVVVEHALTDAVDVAASTVAGEVSGLEVCRITAGPDPRIVIGIGAHDRETFALVNADRDTADALAGVVAHVATHRRPGAEAHPLNRLAVSRLMRARARATPGAVGAGRAEPVAPPVPRRNLLEESPCAALGDEDVLTFVAGVDPGAVPFAVDIAHRHGRTARIVLRGRDDHPVLHRMAALARSRPVFTRFDP